MDQIENEPEMVSSQTASFAARPAGVLSFAEWALREVEHLLQSRAEISSPEERAHLDLRLAVLCDAAERYGRSLTEAADL